MIRLRWKEKNFVLNSSLNKKKFHMILENFSVIFFFVVKIKLVFSYIAALITNRGPIDGGIRSREISNKENMVLNVKNMVIDVT